MSTYLGKASTPEKNRTQMDEREILSSIARVQASESPEAWSRLMKPFKNKVYFYAHKFRKASEDVEDYAAEGWIGFIEAVRKVDVRNPRYVVNKLCFAIHDAIYDYRNANRSVVHIPAGAGTNNSEDTVLRRYEEAFYTQYGRTPNEFELSQVSGLSPLQVRNYRTRCRAENARTMGSCSGERNEKAVLGEIDEEWISDPHDSYAEVLDRLEVERVIGQLSLFQAVALESHLNGQTYEEINESFGKGRKSKYAAYILKGAKERAREAWNP